MAASEKIGRAACISALPSFDDNLQAGLDCLNAAALIMLDAQRIQLQELLAWQRSLIAIQPKMRDERA